MAPAPAQQEAPINADDVRAQLKHLLGHPVFRGSHRCAQLLEYIVEYKLRGETVPPKERILGIEVFHRDPDYDTSEDSVVRSAANEVRKRIAQYYQQPGHENELHFDLPAGSYMPEFRPPRESIGLEGDQSAVRVRRGFSPKVLILSAAALILCLIGVFWLGRPSALDRFWGPVLDSHNRLLVCVRVSYMNQSYLDADGKTPIQASQAPSTEMSSSVIPYVEIPDNMSLLNLAGFLNVQKTKFVVQYCTTHQDSNESLIQPSLDELRKGPSLFLGTSDWPQRMLSTLRFHIRWDLFNRVTQIEDSQNPSNKKWYQKIDEPYGERTEGYTIITRIFDSTTKQAMIFITGLGPNANAAAIEYITDPSCMNEVAPGSSPEWQKNLQIVIHTRIAGKAWGNPQLLAKHFW
jgi:hypothetical protein